MQTVLGNGITEQLLKPVKILKGSCEFELLVYMDFVNLNKAYDNFPHIVLRDYLWEHGMKIIPFRLGTGTPDWWD